MTRAQPLRESETAYQSSLLIYDADCTFCTTSAKWLERHMRRDSATVAAWQSLDLQPFNLTEDDVTTAAWWIDEEGKSYGAHLAIARAMRSCGPVISVAGLLIEKPPVRWVAAPVYRWIARNRQRMPGGTESCAL
jgi:predicted DCC family thiol-disulfide oxidoreductase YuxK